MVNLNSVHVLKQGRSDEHIFLLFYCSNKVCIDWKASVTMLFDSGGHDRSPNGKSTKVLIRNSNSAN